MSKESWKLQLWMEVAPAPIINPRKPSNSPALETIAEDIAEEGSNVWPKREKKKGASDENSEF
ncbi:hypothetical protein SLEP1_g17627 [Rubroshorea leprosula]|uniref:Uncharacterized protein n=1 Tax=Rubroshorea leprosula TaxID=152421 RepID=A0AAV5J3S7_9ROSI|nr:hypothetical protein SLEP1_g17627 [Rubroshorea leprosula]